MYQCAAEARAARALASSLLVFVGSSGGLCSLLRIPHTLPKMEAPLQQPHTLASHVAALAPERSNENR